MAIEQVLAASRIHFPGIVSFKDNSAVMLETIEIEKLRQVVIEHLKRLENGPGEWWWEDKELFALFDRLYASGVIFLPNEVVDRVRWIALVCIGICEMENYSYGNILIPLDYLPSETLDEYVSEFSFGTIEDVRVFREKLIEGGWTSLF